MAIEVSFEMPRDESGEVAIYTLEVPAIPPVDTHVSHDGLGFSGWVKSLDFWWDESGELHVTAMLK